MTGLLKLHLPVLTAALMLAVVWDLGYGLLSLESGVALFLGLCVGTLLDLLSMRSPRIQMVFQMLLFVSMLDIFFLKNTLLVGMVLIVGLYLAWRWHSQIPPNVLVLVGVVFALSLSITRKSHQGASPVDPPISESTDDQFLVHLVMDELGAFDSVPSDIEKAKDTQELSAQYVKRGFILYPNIESVSPDTQLSMAALMDDSYVGNPKANVEKMEGQDAYRIINNLLQLKFKNYGWGVTVVQSQYVNYCQSGFSCYTYGWGSSSAAFESISDLHLRLQVLVREFLGALISESRSLEIIEPFRYLILDKVLPKGGWRNPTLPFVAISQLNYLQNSLIKGKGKHYVFAHILAPHFPWVFDEKCNAKSLDNWLLPYAGRFGTIKGARQEATDAYWAQSVCVHQTLLNFIDSVDAAHPGRARFVIHGDHGPRTRARRVTDAHKPEQVDEVRKNVQSPFVATRIVSDRIMAPPTDTVLQTLLSELLNAEAQVN